MKNTELMKKIIRFDASEEEIIRVYQEEDLDEFIDEKYKVTIDDFLTACDNMLKALPSYDVYESWFEILFTKMYANGYSFEFCKKFNHIVPLCEEDIVPSMYLAFSDLSDLMGGMDSIEVDTDEGLTRYLEQIMDIYNNYKLNAGKDISEYILTDKQIDNMIAVYRFDSKEMDKKALPLLKRIVEEGVAENDEACLDIKGYSCYGGDDLYECDWKASEECMLKLLDMTGNTNYANTLGYIYYYGRTNDGNPEYEKAFKYYVMAALMGNIESNYKLADMYAGGKGVEKNVLLSDSMIIKMYRECRQNMKRTFESKLPDVALRYTNMLIREEAPTQYILESILEAKAVSDERLAHSDFFGDVQVGKTIDAMYEEYSEKYLKENEKEDFDFEIKSDFPDFLMFMVDGRCGCSVEKAGNNKFNVTVSSEDFVFATFVEMGQTFTGRRVSFEVRAKDYIGEDTFAFDYIDVDEGDRVIFLENGKNVATFGKDAEFILRRQLEINQ